MGKNGKSIEERRAKQKVRSKKWRDSKKSYQDELEFRVKELERENVRLQNMIDVYKAHGADKLIKDQDVGLWSIPKLREKLVKQVSEKSLNDSEEAKGEFDNKFQILLFLIIGLLSLLSFQIILFSDYEICFKSQVLFTLFLNLALYPI